MACLYCGKEIGPFRILRDKEFCCSAHRQGYRARLGKALNRISAKEPPPAPLASFIPYKPFAGNNRTPTQFCTLERFRPEIQLLGTWTLSIVPLPRERAAPLPLIQPHALAEADFSAEPQPWLDDSTLRQPRLKIEAENPLLEFEPLDHSDPAPAGPALLDVPASDWVPGVHSEPEPSWSTTAIRLPASAARVSPARSPQLCAPGRGLLAEAVEAFLPPGPEPQMLAYAAPAVTADRWTLRAADWVVVANLAVPAAAPAAQAVESFLPPFAEPQIVAWPVAATLPRLTIAAAGRGSRNGGSRRRSRGRSGRVVPPASYSNLRSLLGPPQPHCRNSR